MKEVSMVHAQDNLAPLENFCENSEKYTNLEVNRINILRHTPLSKNSSKETCLLGIKIQATPIGRM